MIIFFLSFALTSRLKSIFFFASKPYNIGGDPNPPTLVTKNVEKFISHPFLVFLTTWHAFSNLGGNPCQPINDFTS